MERCRREIARIEEQLRAGHRDVEGLLLALADWSAELRILEGEARRVQFASISATSAYSPDTLRAQTR